MLNPFLEAARRVASGLAGVIGRETEEDYVLRPWTAEEDADFERFCASIGETPSDPVHARMMEDGDLGISSIWTSGTTRSCRERDVALLLDRPVERLSQQHV